MTEHKRHHPLQIRFSIIILGDGGVGKTNLISRITENVFVEDLIPTIGIDFRLKLVPTNKDGTGLSIKTMVWDTAGQERFRSITRFYYRGANGILLVFDVTDRESFDRIHTWMKEINDNTVTPVPILLVGNKIDRKDKRVVSKEEGQKIAEEYENVQYVETSAKTGETDIKDTSVCDVFEEFVRNTYKRHEPYIKIPRVVNPDDVLDKTVYGNPCCPV